MREYLAALVLILYATIALSLAPSWKDDRALWRRVIDVSPEYARGWLNYAAAVQDAMNAGVRMGATPLPKDLFYMARFLATKNPDDRERRVIVSQADQALTIILGPTKPLEAGFYMDEAMRLWPEAFPIVDIKDPGPK